MKYPKCPKCHSTQIVKNGFINNHKQRFKCKDCGYQFVKNPESRAIPKETVELVEKLLSERISQRGICRITGVSLRWLQYNIKKKI